MARACDARAMIVDCESDKPNELPQTLHVRSHVLHADVIDTDTAPGPHDYFDAALASCKTLTALVYAKRHGIALERVASHVERDDSEERNGKYVLRVRLELFGPLSDADKARIQNAVTRCPIHKLMTTTDVVIETLT